MKNAEKLTFERLFHRTLETSQNGKEADLNKLHEDWVTFIIQGQKDAVKTLHAWIEGYEHDFGILPKHKEIKEYVEKVQIPEIQKLPRARQGKF